MFTDKVVLITGGTGSFGGAFLKKILLTDVAEIRIFSRDEKKQHDLRMELNNPKIKYYIGDVRDKESLDYAMKESDYVFHSAALKQIPSCEYFPMEAVKTNIIGTDNVLEKAIQYKIKKVICLSTDKSVYPISAMGISKAMMEKVIVAKSRMSNHTSISCVRYGNVLASRGSVIPLFVSQIKRGMDLTVTDPAMTRFMMSLEDAVDLVLFAFENGKAGDIFVQKSPSATIGQLAKILLQIFNCNSQVVITGARNGDKIHETLITFEESRKSITMNNYFCIPAEQENLSYHGTTSSHSCSDKKMQSFQSNNTKILSDKEVKEILMGLNYIKEELKEQK